MAGVKCGNCDKMGHVEEKCILTQAAVQCVGCWERGHTFPNCPNNMQAFVAPTAAADQLSCPHCPAADHVPAACPKKAAVPPAPQPHLNRIGGAPRPPLQRVVPQARPQPVPLPPQRAVPQAPPLPAPLQAQAPQPVNQQPANPLPQQQPANQAAPAVGPNPYASDSDDDADGDSDEELQSGDEILRILKIVRDRARDKFLTKNLGSRADYKIVLRQIQALARHEGLSEHSDNATLLVAQTCNRAHAWAARHRVDEGKTMADSMVFGERPLWKRFLWPRTRLIDHGGRGELTPLQALQRAEEQEPYSQEEPTPEERFIFVGFTVIKAATEETIKRIASDYLLSKINLCPPPRPTFSFKPPEPNQLQQLGEVVVAPLRKSVLVCTREGVVERTETEPLRWDNFMLHAARYFMPEPPDADEAYREQLDRHCKKKELWRIKSKTQDQLRSAVTWGAGALISIPLALFETYRLRQGTFSFLSRAVAHTLMLRMPLPLAMLAHSVVNCCLEIHDLQQYKLDATAYAEVQPLHGLGRTSVDICLRDVGMVVPPTQDRFQYQPGEHVCIPKFGGRRHWGMGDVVPTIFRQCSCNEEISIKGRVGKKLPCHTSPERMSEVSATWKSTRPITSWIGCVVWRVLTPVPFDEWVKHFPPPKRIRMQRLHEECDLDYDLIASSFMKREWAVKDCAVPNWKDPRFIQGCPEDLSVEAGPYTRKLAKHVARGLRPGQLIAYECPVAPYDMRHITSGKQVVYVCGMSCEQIGHEFARAIATVESNMDPGDELVFIEDDQSRFDLHQLSGAFKALSHVYAKTLPKHIAAKLRRGRSRGRSCLGSKYSVDYTMQSGWPDTSVGDSLLNAVMKYYIHGLGKLWVSIIQGDDSVTVMTRSLFESLGGATGMIEQYSDFGMEVKVFPYWNVLDVEFCSGRFFPIGESYRLVPKSGRLMAKILHDKVDRPASDHDPWLRGIASTLATFGRTDPLLAALASRITDIVGEGDTLPEKFNPYTKWSDSPAAQPSWLEVCTYYDHNYGFSEADVLHCIRTLQTTQLGGHVCDDPLVNLLGITDL